MLGNLGTLKQWLQGSNHIVFFGGAGSEFRVKQVIHYKGRIKASEGPSENDM